MDTTNPTSSDLLAQLSSVVESRDAQRVTELTSAAALLAAEASALQAEHNRLVTKYGETPVQALDASARIEIQSHQTTYTKADLVRASIPVSALEEGVFLVYGRILDSNGNSVTGAKIVATQLNGSPLAKTASKGQGAFELRVPLRSRKEAGMSWQPNPRRSNPPEISRS